MVIGLDYFKENFFSRYNRKSFPVSFRETKKIQSCPACSGTGRTSRNELTDYHKREYDTFHEDCHKCAGQGRIIITEIYVSLGDIPYSPIKKTGSFSNILYETIEEPYTVEGAKDIETSSKSVTFHFLREDIKTA